MGRPDPETFPLARNLLLKTNTLTRTIRCFMISRLSLLTYKFFFYLAECKFVTCDVSIVKQEQHKCAIETCL